jgi:hypothetical protein
MPSATSRQIVPAIIAIDDERRRRRPRFVRRRRAHHAHLNPSNDYALVDMGWMPKLRQLGKVPTLVYIVLCHHANQHRGSCYPSIGTIARSAGGLDLSAIKKALRKLERAGVIFTELNSAPVPSACRPNLYWIFPGPELKT